MKSVLLIDDEEKLRKLMARIIELEKIDVIQAENAMNGLKWMEKQEFDVIICDVRLPDARIDSENKENAAFCGNYPFNGIWEHSG